MPLPKIEVNQYVVFKNQDEWLEGRVVDYTFVKNKISYKILSFKYFTDMIIQDHVLVSTTENIKKVSRYNNEAVILNNKRFLEILDFDKKSKLKYCNPGCTIKKILELFKTHLSDNKLHLSKDEINLCIEGFYDILKEVCNKKIDDDVNNEGIVIGIKVCYLTMKYFLKNETNQDVKNIVYSFCLYFLDYLLVNCDLFYDTKYYV